MRNFALCAVLVTASVGVSQASSCPTAALTTYLNSGSFFSCTENSGNVAISFNHDILPSYVGLNLLGSNNSSADPATINTIPGTPGLTFESSGFNESATLLSSQAELVHFLMQSGTPILSTNFFLENPSVSDGALHLGTGLVIGQELVCVGGTFTSLPTGLITSVTNGLLGTGQFGCNGTALIGTVDDSIGPLSAITGLLGLPDLTGVTDNVSIQFNPTDQTTVDVIKIQALLAVLGGSASTTGFGNSFTVADVPEPSSASLFFLGGAFLLISLATRRGLRYRRGNS